MLIPLEKFLTALVTGRKTGFVTTYAGEWVMLGAYAAAAVLGLLLGLRYRAVAMIAASALVVVAGTVAGPFVGWSIWAAFAAAFGAAVTLQFSYLAGLLLMCAVSRAGAWLGQASRHASSHGAALDSHPTARPVGLERT